MKSILKNTLLAAAVLMAAVSCTKYSATVKGNIAGLDRDAVVFEKLQFNKLSVVDTIKTDADGNFSYKVSLLNDNPGFYYLYRNDV